MRMSEEGLVNLTQPWEEFVAYPYDDKLARVRGTDGKYAYREWKGGFVHGTVTIGYGHTNAAGAPKIVPAMRLTEEQAIQVLLNDMAPVERDVDRLLKVEVTQHQYDTLADLGFNCPSALPHVCKLVNAGNWPSAEKVMLEYVYSKGEYMHGLVRRRAAEIAWAHTHDDKEVAAAAPTSPKAEKKPPKIAAHHIGVAGATVVAGGAGLVPVDILHTNLVASLLGASTAFCAGLIWNGKWRR